ncbi:hypothetical protein [Cetobacterium sp.]|uniref:hypothetical protein n=1 Tax=Cetobacterium sp. TaxID=2071632 RepID=UPI003F3F0B49
MSKRIMKKSDDFPKENFCDFLRKNSNCLPSNLTFDDFSIIFNQLLLQNFGEIQPKTIILNTLSIYGATFEENIKNKKISKYPINDTEMFSILEVGNILCNKYYKEYIKGAYAIHNKK